MYLLFDTETNGLPKNWKAPVSDLGNWPRLLQIAWMLYDQSGKLISAKDFIVKPEGFNISADSTKIHGITTERAMGVGVDLRTVLMEFLATVNQASYLVAHNLSFDEKIVGAEFLRMNLGDVLSSKKRICTMEKTTNFVAIKGAYGNKWPKLSELYYKLFNTSFEEQHNANADIQATARCFWELKRLGII